MKKEFLFVLLFALSTLFAKAQNAIQTGLNISNRQFEQNDTIASSAGLSTTGQVIIQQGTAVAFRSQQHIFLGPGFKTLAGAHFSAVVKKVTASGDSLATIRAIELQDAGLTVYPNPTKNIAYLSSREPFNKVIVVNMLGQVIYACSYSKPATMTIPLDLSGECSGMYLIQVIYRGNLATRKILLEK